MHERFWDPDNRYPDALLKMYQHWAVEVSYRQHTLGSFILFARRPGIERLSELRPEETAELTQVMQIMERTLQEAAGFRADRFNYWQMGNKLKHLHLHGIPRYETPREVFGRTWTHTTWGSVPVWSKRDEDWPLIILIRDLLLPWLS